MTNIEHAFLFLRFIMYFVIAHELFLMSTLINNQYMLWSCRSLCAVFCAIGLRAMLTYTGRGTLPADAILTPLLIASIVILAASMRQLSHENRAWHVRCT